MRETGTWIQDLYRAKNIERFLIECRKTKTNVITRTNRRKKTPSRGNKRKKNQTAHARENEGFILQLIDGGASFEDQWKGEIKYNQCNLGLLSTLKRNSFIS